MNSPSYIDPNRQIMMSLENRFVVFGPEGGLREPLRFDPQDSPTLALVDAAAIWGQCQGSARSPSFA
jgi:hypothetical protein